MTPAQARQVLLVRALESAGTEVGADVWTPADAVWAAREARRQLGEHAGAEAFIARRAELALQRLGKRDPRWREAAQAVSIQVSAGDASNTTTNNVWIEGNWSMQHVSAGANTFVTRTVTVVVNDGTLTLEFGSAANLATRLNYIEVTRN